MNIFKALGLALKLQKKDKIKKAVEKTLFDDPLAIETIKGIAKNYDYHFEIVGRDGITWRFYKANGYEEKPIDDREVW